MTRREVIYKIWIELQHQGGICPDLLLQCLRTLTKDEANCIEASKPLRFTRTTLAGGGIVRFSRNETFAALFPYPSLKIVHFERHLTNISVLIRYRGEDLQAGDNSPCSLQFEISLCFPPTRRHYVLCGCGKLWGILRWWTSPRVSVEIRLGSNRIFSNALSDEILESRLKIRIEEKMTSSIRN